MAAAMKHMASNFAKLEKFEGVDFRWQKKMHFLLSNMSVVYVLTTPMPEDGGDNLTVEQDTLDAKYMAEDASSKKFLVSNFTNYKMTDSRPVLEQYNDLLGILGRFTQHKMNMDESIQLGNHLRIDESHRVQDSDKPKGNNVAGPSVVNMVEHNNSSRYNDNKGKRKHHDNTRADPNKKAKLTCIKGSVDGSSNSLKGYNMVNKSIQVHYVSYVSEAYFVQDDDVAWWVDSGATVHVCKDGCWFKTYKLLNDGSILHMGNESTALVHGRGCVDLRDAIFDENRFSLVPRPSLRIPNGTENNGGSDDPKTFDEAMKSQDVAFWKEAINDEMDSIMGNNTWVLADLPPGCKPLGCKWIFKRKLKVDGTIEKFKARLVIQGFKQKSGIDYFDTYAPVARISTIRLLIAMTSIHNLIIHQMDVKTTFLNGELDEEVYMNQPQGFIMPGNENKDMREANVILVSTPMDTSEKLMPNNGQVISQLEYSRVIGCLMYAMTCTRPDIAFAVGKLSRYTSNPGTQHWQAIQRVLKYLKKTMDYRLTYTGYPSVLEGYTDASWISNTEDNSSTSGWVFLLGGGAISWASKKQTCITGSTMESEFVALAAAGKEAEWLKNLLLEIPLWSKPIAPISIRCDSAATLAKAYSQMYNGKSRHLGVRHSMIRELITNGVVSIEFVRSQQNLADHLTKGLARDLVIKSAEGMGLKSN
ncbi:zinc finger, CCHC-type containing protein [Tanacetum coccineum]|uniref:Zinc finger, CCHC-type containing protein n=1 Tax=Tanacetum coccineum TaxID=301880 RepID=A0ABQ5BSZ4_9ASTR